MLHCPAAGQLLEAIPRRHLQIFEHDRGIQEAQLPNPGSLYVRAPFLDGLPVEQSFRIAVTEAPDHSANSNA